MTPLPIDPLLPALVASLRRTPSLVLEAPPGAGKTTRVPRALLDAGFADRGEILVLQPRRIAARMAAHRVAEELGERVGATIGYTVRFDEASSAKTRVRFVTEGILTRRLLADRSLANVSCVLLDEFHERHIHGDVGLALLRSLQRGARPDLSVVVMSATLDAAPVAAFLGGAPSLRAEGRSFEVAIEYLARPDDRPLAQQVASAVARLASEGLDGDVLVFLPGAAEIRRAREACEPIAQRAGLVVLPLHGDLSPAEQDRAVRPSKDRRVILSTNVAETSVTIDGVVAVIDSGLARIASHSPWSGLPTLRVAKVSRASCTQRAGRAGRTRPGRCLRLFTRHDHDTRPEHEAPEIARLDLAETVLALECAGVRDVAQFDWFEPPPAAALIAAQSLLRRLGARDASGAPTREGRAMLRLPLHPRLARIALTAAEMGLADEGCLLAALLGERDVRIAARGPGDRMRSRRDERGDSDLVEAMLAFEDAELDRFASHALRDAGLDAGAVMSVDRVRRQLTRMVRDREGVPRPGGEAREEALGKAILAGYPDRVGRLRRPANATGRVGLEVVFAGGGTAQLADTSVVRDEGLLVALDAEERSEAGGRARTMVRMASRIQPDWLLELFLDEVRDTIEVNWNATTERVEVTRRMAYESIVLEETPAPPGTAVPARVGDVLAHAAMARGGIRAFVDDAEEMDRWRARVAFVRARFPELELPAMDDAALTDSVREAAANGARSFADLRRADLAGLLRGRLTPSQTHRLDELAPDRVTLPGGRRTKVEYPVDSDPSLSSRLQDFFGMADGPRVGAGRVPVVLHLLAPNGRDVQVTTDLAGFWVRHYPAIARELRRRYPRHSWPDDPRHAEPPAPHVRTRR